MNIGCVRLSVAFKPNPHILVQTAPYIGMNGIKLKRVLIHVKAAAYAPDFTACMFVCSVAVADTSIVALQETAEAQNCRQNKFQLDEAVDRLTKSVTEMRHAVEKFTMEINVCMPKVKTVSVSVYVLIYDQNFLFKLHPILVYQKLAEEEHSIS